MKTLICPLNWGLGHATRCVPIIRQLLADGHEPVVVSDGLPLEFLKQQFPTLRYIEYPSYPVYYGAGKSQLGAMLFHLPDILKGILNEHLWLRDLLRSEHFDRVISDNRFGMWNKNVHTVYITHQLMVKMPLKLKFLEPLVHALHMKFIKQYDECWIPDKQDKGALSGALSHKYPVPANASFIGPLSRFKGMQDTLPDTRYDVVAVISGPEPQRTLFEKDVLNQMKDEGQKALIVSGQPRSIQNESHIGTVRIVSHLNDSELAAVLLGAEKIISRSGYSTIMDLDALGCLHKAEFIPTPGQTEQEYLKVFHDINRPVQ